MNKFLINARFLLLFSMVVAVFSCKNDDDIPTPPDTDNVIASFQYEVDANNPLLVSFMNFSQNANSYSWDFGDGESSTEEAPTHVYGTGGTFTVELTATGTDGVPVKKSESITLTSPDAALALLAGNDSKTWYLQREGIALGIGPGPNDNSWWSFGGITQLGDRPCILDDSFTFKTDGTFEFNSNGTIFIDSEGNGGCVGPNSSEGCYDESTANMTSVNGDDLSAFGDGGEYTFNYDATASTLTIDGEGAFIGLANKTAAGDNFLPLSTKTYSIFNFVEGTVADSLQMSIDIDDNGGSWNFYLVSYKNANDLPAIPGSNPIAGFSTAVNGFEVAFTNTSSSSTTYSWDFGDGMMSSDENPTHTYTAEGEYTITLTAMDDMGGSDMTSQNVIISAASFTADVLSSATGKVWKLDGSGSYGVGPTSGSVEWWFIGLNPDDLSARACQFDDEFIFFDDGTMQFDSKGQVYGEAYMGVDPAACVDDGALTSPYDVFASGTHAFTATDTQITAIGNGAYIGFNKAYNGAELDGVTPPASQIVYDVLQYTNAGGKETVTFTVDYNGGFWTMRIFSEN